MPVQFHCVHCGRKIEAQDSATGKWGKCPACHNRVYVPAPETGEELRLAPIDEAEEQRKKQLLAETYKITQDILQQKEIPEYAQPPVPDMTDEELTDTIVAYLRQMADGQLDLAQENQRIIAAHADRARPIIDQIAVSDMPPAALADVPPQVLAGLIRKLRSSLPADQ